MGERIHHTQKHLRENPYLGAAPNLGLVKTSKKYIGYISSKVSNNQKRFSRKKNEKWKFLGQMGPPYSVFIKGLLFKMIAFYRQFWSSKIQVLSLLCPFYSIVCNGNFSAVSSNPQWSPQSVLQQWCVWLSFLSTR